MPLAAVKKEEYYSVGRGFCLDPQTLCVGQARGITSPESYATGSFQALASAFHSSTSGSSSQWNDEDGTQISELRDIHRNQKEHPCPTKGLH